MFNDPWEGLGCLGQDEGKNVDSTQGTNKRVNNSWIHTINELNERKRNNPF